MSAMLVKRRGFKVVELGVDVLCRERAERVAMTTLSRDLAAKSHTRPKFVCGTLGFNARVRRCWY
jgi:hypothetical protein